MGLTPCNDNVKQEGNPAEANGRAKKHVEFENILHNFQFRPFHSIKISSIRVNIADYQYNDQDEAVGDCDQEGGE